MKDYYNACMDLESIEKAGLDPLKSLILKVKDIYPASSLPSGTGQLSSIVAFLTQNGVDALVSLYVGVSGNHNEYAY
jgi:predicted metalloendopeptidase